MSDIFISYKSTERPAVGRIAEGLRQAGWNVWWDHALLGGQDYTDVIQSEIAKAKIVMPIWSKESINSKWVRAEADAGSDKLLPVTIDPVRPPLPFNKVQTLDLSGWNGDYNDPRWQRLVSDVTAVLSGAAVSTSTYAPPKPRLPWVIAVFLIIVALSGFTVWATHRSPAHITASQTGATTAPSLTPEQKAQADLAALRHQSGQIQLDICDLHGACGPRTLRVGDKVRVRVLSPTSGRLILIDRDASGAQTQIFPEGLTTEGANELVEAGTATMLPQARDGFEFEISEPVGASALIAMVVPQESALAPVLETNRRTRGIQVIPREAEHQWISAGSDALTRYGAAKVAFGELDYQIEPAAP